VTVRVTAQCASPEDENGCEAAEIKRLGDLHVVKRLFIPAAIVVPRRTTHLELTGGDEHKLDADAVGVSPLLRRQRRSQPTADDTYQR
jgi:hypothetical protein